MDVLTNEPAPFDAVGQRSDVRDARYCEFFVVERHGGELRGKVYNTLGLNDCPCDVWSAADTDRLKTELGALVVTRNGPRYFMMDTMATRSVGAEVVTLAGLDMRLVAVVRIAPSQLASPKTYVETTIERTTEYTFLGGKKVYELVPPSGPSYVMQSYAQIVDPALNVASLEGLADRLRLPDGWSYRVRSLEQDLVLRTSGEITVIQDDLENTYQRLDPGTIVKGSA